MRNPVNRELMVRLPTLGLKECHLTAGCLFQAIWNDRSGQVPGWGVKDYDVFYFDDTDLSWEAEDRVIRRVQALVSDLGITVEVKNQARIHCWYAQRFGEHYPQLRSTRDGIDRYLIACTSVALDVRTGELYAPNGLADLTTGHLRINSRHAIPKLFDAKARDYKQRWPWLTIVAP